MLVPRQIEPNTPKQHASHKAVSRGALGAVAPARESAESLAPMSGTSTVGTRPASASTQYRLQRRKVHRSDNAVIRTVSRTNPACQRNCSKLAATSGIQHATQIVAGISVPQ